MEIIDVKQLDDYNTAAEYLIELALTTGDGKMLRAINTLMEVVSRLITAAPDQADSAQMPKCAHCGKRPVSKRPGAKICSWCFLEAMEEFLIWR